MNGWLAWYLVSNVLHTPVSNIMAISSGIRALIAMLTVACSRN